MLCNNVISYLGFNFILFSLKGIKILDVLFVVFYVNFNELNYYDFVLLGKLCVVDCIVNVIKIVFFDDICFSYIFWIDE